MANSAKIGDRIRVLKATLGGKSDRELEMGGLPGGKWLISNGLLSKWENHPVEKITDKIELFLNHYNISREWWKTGEGPIFITHGDIKPVIAENSLGESWEAATFRKMFEGGTPYILVPRSALDGKHRFTSVEQMEIQARELEEKSKELARKDEQIRSLTASLTDLMKDLSSRIPHPPKMEEAKKDAPV